MDAAVRELTSDFGTWAEITEAIDREAKKVERLKNLHKEAHEWPPHQERGFYQDRLKRMRTIQELIHDYDVLASLVMGKNEFGNGKKIGGG